MDDNLDLLRLRNEEEWRRMRTGQTGSTRTDPVALEQIKSALGQIERLQKEIAEKSEAMARAKEAEAKMNQLQARWEAEEEQSALRSIAQSFGRTHG